MKQAIDIQREKKRNLRLALTVAAMGVLSFLLLYALSFALMIFKPSLIFDMMPVPTITEDVAAIKNRLYIFGKTIKPQGSFFETAAPKEITVLQVFDTSRLSKPEEIKPYSSMYQWNDKIYFFSRGLYRVFDGDRWQEHRVPGIGFSPKGAVADYGIWVLSKTGRGIRLCLIKDGKTREISLPEFLDTKKTTYCSIRLDLFRGVPLLLWQSDDEMIYASFYNGREWSLPESIYRTGNYGTFNTGEETLIYQTAEGPDLTRLTLYRFENSQWKEIGYYDIEGLTMKLSPVLFHGRIALYQQTLFSQNLYLFEDNQLSNPIKISGPFFLQTDRYICILVPMGFTLLFFILILVASMIVNRFKLRHWQANSKEYEFASLFRRFLAKTIDSILLSIPMIGTFYIFYKGNYSENPFLFFALAFLSGGFMLIGGFLYHSILEGVFGKTLGKKICGIKVVRDDLSKCGIPRAMLRNLLRIIDGLFYYFVGVISITATLKWQRLGDLAAETVVVRDSTNITG